MGDGKPVEVPKAVQEKPAEHREFNVNPT